MLIGTPSRLRRAGLTGLVLLGAAWGTPSAGQIPPCPPPAEADTGWSRFPFVGLHLDLRLPAELRATPFASLRSTARRMREQEIPAIPADSIELLAAWETSKAAAGAVRQVLLYSVPPGTLPSGRPCSMVIAGQPALVFRRVVSGGGRSPNEFWTEAYWPGFGIALRATALDAYAGTLAMLRSIERRP